MAYYARALLGGAQFRFQEVVLDVAFMLSKVRRVIDGDTVFGALEIKRAFGVIVFSTETQASERLQEASNAMQEIVDSFEAFSIGSPPMCRRPPFV